ncbi:hypothetical protein [Geofilum rubicundum]|uniref:Uncharacterized protein n=1 Tax=Geofilum rubicundum JCM 15548 TaxID=1236989 RepID=A0A0E9M2R1_9BACT|nr:hypothetical protein [Geofilum rubicundum]GAO31686.1 hypothetical protein JCM15548_14075 [Geofilum rubicundum JCM 15548]
MPRYISEEDFTHLRNHKILYEGYVIGVGYAYKNTIDPGKFSNHGIKCNLASLEAQFVDVSQEAYNRSFLQTETETRQSSTHVEPHWKEKLSNYPHYSVSGDKEASDEDREVSLLIAFLKAVSRIKLSGSGDHVGDGRLFSQGTFLTLTSKNGGFGPPIHSGGNIKIIYVDADRLPGLLGLARGRGATRYKSRNVPKTSRLAKAVEAIGEQMENLIDTGTLLNAQTSVQQALMTEIKAGDRFFNNDTDSALIREKDAWEMAGRVRADTIYFHAKRTPSYWADGDRAYSKGEIMGVTIKYGVREDGWCDSLKHIRY